MSFSATFIIVIALAIIIGGIIVLKKSARKFYLTEEQLNRIKKRNKDQSEKDNQNK